MSVEINKPFTEVEKSLLTEDENYKQFKSFLEEIANIVLSERYSHIFQVKLYKSNDCSKIYFEDKRSFMTILLIDIVLDPRFWSILLSENFVVKMKYFFDENNSDETPTSYFDDSIEYRLMKMATLLKNQKYLLLYLMAFLKYKK